MLFAMNFKINLLLLLIKLSFDISLHLVFIPTLGGVGTALKKSSKKSKKNEIFWSRA